MKKHICLFVLLITLLILVLPSLVVCRAQSGQETSKQLPAGFSEYRNDDCGYVIGYPQGWKITEDEGDMKLTKLTMIEPSPKRFEGIIDISTLESPYLLCDAFIHMGVNLNYKVWKDYVIRRSEANYNSWDMYVNADYMFNKRKMQAESFFKKTENNIYVLNLRFEKEYYDIYPLSDIVDSFRLTGPSPIQDADRGEMIKYKNSEYNYSIEYPSSWTIDDEETKYVSLNPQISTNLLVVSIFVEQTDIYPLINEVTLDVFYKMIADERIKSFSKDLSKNDILYSGEHLSSQWDWFTVSTHDLEKFPVCLAAYYKLTPEALYRLFIVWNRDRVDILRESGYDIDTVKILESFKIK